MGKGKRKTTGKGRPENTSINGRVETEAKENIHGKPVTCQEQPTIDSFLKPSKSRSGPLAPVKDNSATSSFPDDTSKQSEVVKGSNELNAPIQKNAGKQIQFCGPNEQTVMSQEDSRRSKQSKSGQELNSKTKKSTERKGKSKDSECSRKVTDYYPIRRSCRKSKAELKDEKQQHIDHLITNNVEDGLKVKHIEGKGRGIFADRDFQKGQFVVEYHGDLLEIADAKERESQYAQDPTTGCYMYYFRYLGKTYCVDATKETNRLGRLINHSKNGNLQTKLHGINGKPHLILLASRDIRVDEELLYDYGDRSKEAIAAHPWLKN